MSISSSNPVISLSFLPILLDLLVRAKKGIRIINFGGIPALAP